jgi:hypothetical protein
MWHFLVEIARWSNWKWRHRRSIANGISHLAGDVPREETGIALKCPIDSQMLERAEPSSSSKACHRGAIASAIDHLCYKNLMMHCSTFLCICHPHIDPQKCYYRLHLMKRSGRRTYHSTSLCLVYPGSVLSEADGSGRQPAWMLMGHSTVVCCKRNSVRPPERVAIRISHCSCISTALSFVTWDWSRTTGIADNNYRKKISGLRLPLSPIIARLLIMSERDFSSVARHIMPKCPKIG